MWANQGNVGQPRDKDMSGLEIRMGLTLRKEASKMEYVG